MIHPIHYRTWRIAVVYSNNTHFADLKRSVYFSAYIKTHCRNVTVIIGHLIKQNAIGAPFSVTGQLKSQLGGVI